MSIRVARRGLWHSCARSLPGISSSTDGARFCAASCWRVLEGRKAGMKREKKAKHAVSATPLRRPTSIINRHFCAQHDKAHAYWPSSVREARRIGAGCHAFRRL